MTEIEKLQKEKQRLLQKMKPMAIRQKKLAKQADISEPFTPEEAKLNKELSGIFSEINQIVRKINKLNRENKQKK
jgi:flagellar biosynthesis/type III secretory pathway chaperone